MVVGGQPSHQSVEIINLSGDGKVCPDVSPIPEIEYGAVGTFIDGSVLVCGGTGADGNTDSCFTYHVNGSWTQSEPLPECRAYAAAAVFNPSEWWITGGYCYDDPHYNHYQSTLLYSNSTSGFQPYVDLPYEREYHNLVRVNSTQMIMLGHIDLRDNVELFDKDNMRWSSLPNLPRPRENTQAGFVQYPDHTSKLVVAGGDETPSTDILDMDTMTWRPGPRLPFEILSAASVPFKEGFLIVGGYGGLQDTYLNSIFYFDPSREEWDLMYNMTSARYLPAAFLIPDWFANCT